MLDHAAFRLNRLNAENVIDNNYLEHVVIDKPIPTLSRHDLTRKKMATRGKTRMGRSGG